jgi:hypothetical protein
VRNTEDERELLGKVIVGRGILDAPHTDIDERELLSKVIVGRGILDAPHTDR